MKKLYTMLCGMRLWATLLLLAAATSPAFALRDGYLEYTLDNKTKTATLTTYYSGLSGEIYIPMSVTYDDELYPVTKVAEGAFRNAKEITRVSIFGNLSTIGDNAFSGCDNLTELIISDSRYSILRFGKDVFEKTLESVYIGNNISYADSEYDPDEKKWHYYSPFVSQPKLTKVRIGAYVTEIGSYAFGGCSSLSEVTIPHTIKRIGEGAFRGCLVLKSFIIEDGEAPLYLEGDMFSNTIETLYLGRNISFEPTNGPFQSNTKIQKITVGNYVTSIRNDSFSGCSGLTEVVLPESITSIGEFAFSNCTSLPSVTIPESVTAIGGFAFYNCKSVTSITIGGSVKTIGESAFKQCDKLAEIYCYAIKPPISATDAFSKYSSVRLNVFAQSLDAYQAAEPWSFFYSIRPLDIQQATSLSLNAKALTLECGDSETLSVSVVPANSYSGLISWSSSDESVASIDAYCKVTANKVGTAIITAKSTTGLVATCEVTVKEKLPYGIIYDYNDDDMTCTLVGFKPGVDPPSHFEIPDMVNGYKVTKIGFGALYGYKRLYSVTIGNNVREIGQSAFNSSINLESVTLPNSLEIIGSSAFCNCPKLTEIFIPNSVTSLGEDAFNDCTSLTTINLPDKITEIGGSLFANCSNLSTISIPSTVKKIGFAAFYKCTSLKSVVIPDRVTVIENDAFSDCPSLESVFIGESVVSLAGDVFGKCPSLAAIYCYAANPPHAVSGDYATFDRYEGVTLCVPKGSVEAYKATAPWSNFSNISGIGFSYAGLVYSYNDAAKTCTLVGYEGDAPTGELVIPESVNGYRVTAIGNDALSKCKSITKVTIPSSVSRIGKAAFFGCSAMTAINIPAAVTVIESNTFDYCSALNEISIPASVTEIGGGAFQNCDALTEVEIPESVTAIGERAFAFCSSLAKITIPNSVVELGKSVFYGCSSLAEVVIPESLTSIPDLTFAECASLAKVSIPNSITSIGVGAFRGSLLTEVTLSNSITEIGAQAFFNCKNLKAVVIPDKLSVVKDGIFADCTSLETVTIGKSVTTMERSAFFNCSLLTTIYCYAVNPPHAESGDYATFGRYEGVTLYVPKGSLQAYSTTEPWSNFFIIKELETEETSISFANGTVEITEGEILELTLTKTPNDAFIGEITWSSSDENIASVDASGKVTAIKAGKATITATSSTGLTATCEVTVNEKHPDGVIFSYNDDDMTCALVGFTAGHNPVGSFKVPGVVNGYKVTTIDKGAFKNITTLTSLTIPGSVTRINDEAFWGCTSLANLILEDGESPLFFSYIYLMFSPSLESIYLGRNITFRASPFKDQIKLKTVTISESVSEMGYELFSGCSALTEITIPKSVKTIGDDILYGCFSIKKIYSHSLTPPSASNGSFRLYHSDYHYDTAELYVPKEAIEAYKSIYPWNRFFIIKEFETTAIDNVAADGISVTAEGGEIVITAPEGGVAEVFAITGAKVCSTTERRISGLAPGIYIVRITGKSFKVKL